MASALAAVSIMLAAAAKGQSGTYNGLEWYQVGNAIEIYGYIGSGGAVAIPSTINKVPVTSIGVDVFDDVSSLTSVAIGTNVTSIGESAFYGCRSLTSVTIPNGVTNIWANAFYGCSSLTTETIPNSVTSIGDNAFYACSSLTDVTISTNVTSLGTWTFAGCGSLANVAIPNSVTSIGVGVFDNCSSLTDVTIGTNATSIGEYAFYGCSSLRAVSIPNSVTNIGDYALEFCTSLAAITVDAQNAFYSSTNGVLFDKSLTTLVECPGGLAGSYTIPGSVSFIGDYAFEGCINLTSVTIPESVIFIGDYVFEYCTSLTTITVDAQNLSYSSTNGVLFDKSQASLIECPGGLRGSYTIPSSVTAIGEQAFVYCTNLTNVTIPNSVTFIGDYAFEECINLTRVCFEGNEPFYGADIFGLDSDLSAIYYIDGTAGWGSTFDNIRTASCAECGGGALGDGALQVTITPAAAITEGARWQVDSGTDENSGVTLANLSAGSHAVSFTPVSGWKTPSNQTVTITDGATTAASGVYMAEVKGHPKLAISSPKSGQSVRNALLLVVGTVTDNVLVGDVYYQLNGGAWTLATTANSWSNWTTSATLTKAGPNTTSAYAVDSSGTFSGTNTVLFTYVPSATLVVLTNGNGTVTPNDNGKLLTIGTDYTLKATPANNYAFSNWVGGARLPYAVLSTRNSYTFTMESNLVLQANFVLNPFLSDQGTFNGLFLDTDDVTEASSGFFTLALTTIGAFTGKIMTSGGTYSLPTTTPFDAGGQVQFTVPSKQGTLTFNLQLDLSNSASQQIAGTVSDGVWTAGLTADRATFSANTNKAVNYEGQYTLAMAGSEDAVTSPGGFGCATVSLNSAGLITMKGNLGDGTAMSQAVSVSKDGRWPFYAAYPAAPAGNGGAVLGWLTFSNQPASALGGTLYWFRPAGVTPAVYQGGFTNLALPVIGSPYHSTEKPPLALTTAQVTLDGGNLPFTLTNQITLESSGTIIVSPPNTDKLALTINKTTGAISGSFLNPANPKQTIKINGILFQNQTNAAGYFLGTNQGGAFLLENP